MSDTSAAETTVFSDQDHHPSPQLCNCVERLRTDGVETSIDYPGLFVDWNVHALVQFEGEAGASHCCGTTQVRPRRCQLEVAGRWRDVSGSWRWRCQQG
eukprot:897996-Rhodomonas_salina.1